MIGELLDPLLHPVDVGVDDPLPPGESALRSYEAQEDVVHADELAFVVVPKLAGEALVRRVGVHDKQLHELLVAVVIVQVAIVVLLLFLQIVAAAVRLVIVGVRLVQVVVAALRRLRYNNVFA